jgi:hypothetical protein
LSSQESLPNYGDFSPDLVINAATTYFDGPVSNYANGGAATPVAGFAQDLVRSLVVNGLTVVQANPANPSVAGNLPYLITTYRNQVFNAAVTDRYGTTSAPALFYSIAGDIKFMSTLDAAVDTAPPSISVFAPLGNVLFADRVGSLGTIQNLTVQADANDDQTITIAAIEPSGVPDITVAGNISFNEYNLVNALNGKAFGDSTTFTDIPANTSGVFSTAAGTSGVPRYATIADPTGDLVLSAGGNFTVGGNNKITAANGNLTITAGSVATIGDLNAFDSITVNAPTINFLSRTPSFLLNPDGSTRNDYALNAGLTDGVDIVANGTFNFSGAFSGTKPVFGSPLASPDASATGTLAANNSTVVQTDPALTAAPFFSTAVAGPVSGYSRVLDETIVIPTSPVPDPGVLILAGPIPWVDRMVREPLVGPEARLSLAQDMSVAPRDPTTGEYVYSLEFIRLWNDFTAPAGGLSASVAQLLSGTGTEYAAMGPTFLVDAPATEGANGKPRDVEINRIRRAQALAAVEDYRSLFQPESQTTAGPIDAKAAHARAVQLKELFTLAWKTYSSNAHGQPVNAAGFGNYLGTLPPASPLAQDVLKMRDLLTNAHLAGFSDVEFNDIVNAVLAPLAPQTLTVPDFFQAITGAPLHRAHNPAVTARLD